MKILDRYLIRQFVQTILFGILAFTIIFVVIDAIENLDDFIDQGVPGSVILHYYFVFTPEIIKLITPVSVLFAALFTAGKTANLSELTAIKASGVSLYRFMAPFIVTTLIVSCISVYFAGYLVPMANQTKINIERNYLKRGFTFAGSNIFFQDIRTRIIGISYYDNNANQATRVTIQEFSTSDLTQMVNRIDATSMIYDSTKIKWIAINGVKRVFDSTGQKDIYFDSLELAKLNFVPDDLLKKQQKPEEMNLSELNNLVANQKLAGNDPTSTLIEFHSRFAFPAASLVVVLFGLPISANKRKGGLAVQVGINILVTFIYLVFMKISQAFGKNGALDPFITAWVANFIFLAGAVYNIIRAKG